MKLYNYKETGNCWVVANADVCDKGLQFAASSHENKMHAREIVV